MLGVLAVRFLVLCSYLLLKTFTNPCVLISAGAFVFKATDGVRQKVLLKKVERLLVGLRDILNKL
jgi:hypothetical protein